MKVFYQKGSNWRATPARLPSEDTMLSLSFNNWDDYGVSTTLNAALYVDGEVFIEFGLKLLIENDNYSPKKLNELCNNGWDGFFPIPETNYVSVPSDIDFYNFLIAKIGIDEAKNVLSLIRDAGYLKNVIKDENAIKLIEHDDFSTSPLREAGARKAYEDGWKLFNEKVSSIKDFTLNTIRRDGLIEPIRFKFNSDLLPYDINVLIGENGIGKSYTLKSLVEYWLGVERGSKLSLDESQHKPFDHYPNISKLILISYSPFEEFTIDLSKTNLNDKDAYRYFGFRRIIKDLDGNQRVGISRNLPASDSVSSILKSLHDDLKFGSLPNWTYKFETILSVLMSAIDFDFIAFEIIKDFDLLNQIPDFSNFLVGEGKKYLKIDNHVIQKIDEWNIDLKSCIKFESGTIFIKENKAIEISSGQRLFCYIVVNVVGQIRKDSLVVIDEPELFLHPALEIEFIELLKKVLKAFTSKAILATHSLAITREVPAKCVHVYRKQNDQVEVEYPPFETFGGDMQRISSYVFGDNSITKPFDKWIEEQLAIYEDPQDIINKLGDELNEEMLIKLLNSRKSHGI
ncbi:MULTISPECIES: AAA family ATPase [Providencia]|uniref:AAA family ATPase n=1 Tax=Providencia TaxID=586 RepID=UPI0019803991|nr:AAA family ATPase [Providencia stuartii]MBN4864790.1 AAA family ATPase [Providencia stuartii]MBN4873764.1 AAA family ATPase [Providencia stuartii]MBN4878455.1 AAA family ATPase [Providencia stuartii]MBN4883312.1 AAA family ATPase [Providencia stuartii]